MIISLNWINKYINLTEKDPKKIASIITEKSAEIESITMLGEKWKNIVIGEIKEINQHKNADSLKICFVDIGEKELIQIVCGGSNLNINQKVAVALIGSSVLWHGEGDPIIMKKTKIRGIESFGMICASEELSVENIFPKTHEKEILDLSNYNVENGESFAKLIKLDDVIFEIENTSITNRADLFSHIGIAREFVACKLGTYKDSFFKDINIEKSEIDFPLSVKFPKDQNIISEYNAVYIENIDASIKSSIEIQSLLKSIGIKPINAIVDITNFVMFEYGMPLHAFDFNSQGKNWNFEVLEKEEKMVNLDDDLKKIPKGSIVLKDKKNEIFDCCGIQGGKNSGIKDSTNSVILHSPIYNPVKIRKTSISINQRTDASIIYEKDLPNRLSIIGLKRSLELLKEHFINIKISKIFNPLNAKTEKNIIKIKIEKINSVLGIKIKEEEIKNILESLLFRVEIRNDILTINVPYFRKDIRIEEDIIEEVIRIYGLNSIEEVAPSIVIENKKQLKSRLVEERISKILTENQSDEVLSFSFYGKKLLEKMNMEINKENILIENPISEDLSCMRSSLSPGLLEIAESNIKNFKSFRIFESGKIFSLKNNKKQETHRITALFVGDDFFNTKAVAEKIIDSFNIPHRIINENCNLPFSHPVRHASLIAGKNAKIKIFEVHPRISKRFSLPKNTSILCIETLHFKELLNRNSKINKLSPYPEITYDFSVICDSLLPVANLIKNLGKIDKVIKNVKIDSVWRGKGVTEGKKSVTLSFIFQSYEKTLKEKEIKNLEKKIIQEVENRGGVFRF
jgi:phenylalanyl-tRNA synthetase beta chain